MVEIVRYNAKERESLIKKLMRGESDNRFQPVVDEIIETVRNSGDSALLDYTKRFDGADLSSLIVTDEEIKAAVASVDKDLIEVMKRSIERIRVFHEKQKQNSWFEAGENGEILGQLIRAVERCGVYVPGGKAAYPSSVLMNIIPAKVAGVKEIYMTTPPSKDGSICAQTVAAAHLAGVTRIFKVGGAQAIAALAFGTETIPRVDKIVGPGNIYVALAKRSVYGYVNIDSVAGPSEILIIADGAQSPCFVAADMLSQAEHDEMASSILVTDSQELAERVVKELEVQSSSLSRRSIIEQSLRDYGKIFVTDNLDDGIELSNLLAPEHLEIMTAAPFEILPKIKNAGAIFLGAYSPEPAGDYCAGPNHVLPTGQTARFFSPLSVDDFIKKSSIISFTKPALSAIASDCANFAYAEGLSAHANAVERRFK